MRDSNSRQCYLRPFSKRFRYQTPATHQAEDERFELPVALPTTVFQTVPFNQTPAILQRKEWELNPQSLSALTVFKTAPVANRVALPGALTVATSTGICGWLSAFRHRHMADDARPDMRQPLTVDVRARIGEGTEHHPSMVGNRTLLPPQNFRCDRQRNQRSPSASPYQSQPHQASLHPSGRRS